TSLQFNLLDHSIPPGVLRLPTQRALPSSSGHPEGAAGRAGVAAMQFNMGASQGANRPQRAGATAGGKLLETGGDISRQMSLGLLRPLHGQSQSDASITPASKGC